MIIVGGENLIDLVQTGDRDGKPLYQANPGGSPYNCAAALGRQGLDVSYVTPISTDSLGDLLARHISASGVALSGPRREEPTSMAVVSIVNDAPSYAFYRTGTAERMVTKESILQTIPAEARAFQIGSLALNDGDDAVAWEAVFAAMKDRGVLASIDPNVRPSLIANRATYTARIERMMRCADVLKISDEDLEWLYPGQSLDEIIAMLRPTLTAGIFVVTKGPNGAIGFANGHRVIIPAAPVVNLVDTVGAGDTFMATLLAGAIDAIPQSEDALRTLLVRCSTAAAINCGRRGCQPPTRDELDATLASAG